MHVPFSWFFVNQVRMDRSRQEQERLLSMLESNEEQLSTEIAEMREETLRLKEENSSKDDALQKLAKNLAEAELNIEALKRQVLVDHPPPINNQSELSSAFSNRGSLEKHLSHQRELLEGKRVEKARLEDLLGEQRSALTRQLEEKARLEQLLEEKDRLENELLRQRGVLEQELTLIGGELEKRQAEAIGHGQLDQAITEQRLQVV